MNGDETNRGREKAATDAEDQKALQSNESMDAEKITAAHEQAEKDMDDDAEFTASSPNDDLDEGETARLGEEKTGLV